MSDTKKATSPTKHGVPTEVWFVQGKKNNRAFKEKFNPPTLRPEEAFYWPDHPETNPNKENDAQRDVNKKT